MIFIIMQSRSGKLTVCENTGKKEGTVVKQAQKYSWIDYAALSGLESDFEKKGYRIRTVQGALDAAIKC